MGDDPTVAGERDLLKRSQQGDVLAFDELITLHRNRIYMHIYHIVRHEEDALDLTQETFLRAWRSLGRFDGKAAFGSWLHRIATNAAIDLCRRRNNRPQVEWETGPMKIDAASRTTPSASADPAKSLDRQEIQRRIEAAFAELSPDHRAVIVLKELEDFSYEEIAREVGCSLGTVMSRLFHARKKLQTLLSDLHDEI